MSDERKYVRVYHGIIDDPRFAAVICDDAAGWTWIRLLIIADQAWPSSAYLPRWVRSKPLATLTAAGLVEVDGDVFRIHGLDPERQRRRDSASDAAARRWHGTRDADSSATRNANGTALRTAESTATRSPDGNAESMPTRPEQTKADQSRAAGGGMGRPGNGRATLGVVPGMSRRAGIEPVSDLLPRLSASSGGGEADA